MAQNTAMHLTELSSTCLLSLTLGMPLCALDGSFCFISLSFQPSSALLFSFFLFCFLFFICNLLILLQCISMASFNDSSYHRENNFLWYLCHLHAMAVHVYLLLYPLPNQIQDHFVSLWVSHLVRVLLGEMCFQLLQMLLGMMSLSKSSPTAKVFV